MTLKDEFFKLYYIEKKEPSEIKTILQINDTTYGYYLKVTKPMLIPSITTEVLEALILPKLSLNPDADTIKLAMEIWKYKHKIPQQTSLLDVDIAES